MSTIIRMLPAIAVILATAWFVSFEYNPYRWCVDHPDPNLTSTHYLCEPFEFDFKKDTFKTNPFETYQDKNQARHFNQKRESKIDCSNADVLMTKEGYDFCVKK